jgi:polysaccharide pyruvyl transferase WcaK-like protein
LRDEASKQLLLSLGVRRFTEVTADPVWALSATSDSEFVNRQSSSVDPLWGVALRSWPGEQGSESTARFVTAVRAAAKEANARLRFLPMQHPADFAILHEAGIAESEISGGPWQHPRDTMAQTQACDLVIAMRLHALIFAAAGRVPCVAVNYDPKVEALAKLIGAPLINGAAPEDLAQLPNAIASTQPIDGERLESLRQKARRNAEFAVGLT